MTWYGPYDDWLWRSSAQRDPAGTIRKTPLENATYERGKRMFKHGPRFWAPIAAAALLAALSFGAGASVTRAASACVNPGGTAGCSSTIQAAVDAAKAGDTITVAAGTYKEMVTVSKALTLQGAGAATTTIDATGLDHAIAVQGVSGPAVVTGFTAENANLSGVLLRDSSGITLSNNTVQNNDKSQGPAASGGMGTCTGYPTDGDCGEGINFQGLSDSVISNNLVQGNDGGMLVTDESGPTHDNIIEDNTIQNNPGDCGITLASHPSLTPPSQPGPPSSGGGVWGNTVEDNMIMGNGSAGVGVFDTVPGSADFNNIIEDNTIMNNGLPGVALHLHSSGPILENNVIEDNMISGNGDDLAAGGSPKSGIEIFADATGAAPPITGTLVEGNTISSQDVGVWVGTNATDAAVHDNDLTGSTVGVQNAGTGTVDANWNYWGCAGGPAASGCAGMKGTVGVIAWLPSAPTSSPYSMP